MSKEKEIPEYTKLMKQMCTVSMLYDDEDKEEMKETSISELQAYIENRSYLKSCEMKVQIGTS